MAKRALPVLPEGFGDDKLPSRTFSHSQYSLYKNCPKAYEFKYVLKQASPSKPAMLRGVLFHSAVEHVLRKRMNGEAVTLQEAHEVIDHELQLGDVDVDWRDSTPDATKSAARQSYTVYHQKGLSGIHPIAVEHLFTTWVGDVPVLGYMDVIHQSPGDPAQVVVDLKTSKSAWSDRDIRLSTQLTLYALAHGTQYVQIDNVVARASGYDFQRKTDTRDVGQMRVLTEDIGEVAHLIRTGIFPRAAIDHWMCSKDWCSFWEGCRGKKY